LREGYCSRSLRPGAFDPLVVGLQGEGHQIPLPNGHLLYGPQGREGGNTPTDRQPLHLGVRASVRDHLPLVGAVPDLDALNAQWPELRRNDRLPIPRKAGLWMFTALGGRGLLWCLPAAEHIAAQLSEEASPLDARLSAALDPARFLRRAWRSGMPNLTHALSLA
jgi:tRNA 5-methylaminomethyl-2-thiouridine biosynthesis bifunctional protein